MSVPRQRPLKMFRVVTAFGPYQVGAMIQPTGIYRDALLQRKLIEEVTDAPVPAQSDEQPALALDRPRSRKG